MPDTILQDEEAMERRARSWAADLMRDRLQPPPDLTVSEWADQHRKLPETAAEPGPWRTSRAPYLREIMDAFSNEKVRRVVFMKGVQLGGSEVLLNTIGYFIDQDPAPILYVQVSAGDAQNFSKERIAPMIRECPVLREKVAPPKSRDSGNTIDSKDFPGGHLGVVGANSPSKLRARPRRVVLFDDVDAFPASAGDEGDPIELGVKRTSTFWNSKVGIVSTPTISDLSRIEKAYDQTDRSQYWVPCPHCEHMQTLEFENLKWETDEEGDEKEHHPDTARYLCEGCGTLIHERHKPKMLEEGEWRARDDDPRQRGFHLNDLYSPWVEWETIVREFLEAKGHPEKLQVFVNTRLGEAFDEKGQQLDTEPLLRRREEYPPEPLPEGVALVTAGVDVQADRLECELVGWGPGEESWSLDYFRIPGDPSVSDVWKDLDDILGRRFMHPVGVKIPVAATCVDSGYMTQQVYDYCGERQNERIWAIKGMDGMGRPIIDRPRRNTRNKVPLYPVGVDAAKTAIYKRLRIEDPGEGYCHFPRREPYDEEYFRQLTSEKLVRKTGRRGQQKLQWVRRPNRRAEALDVRVYAMAALEELQVAGADLERSARNLRQRAEPDDDDGGPSSGGRSRRRGGGWRDAWKP